MAIGFKNTSTVKQFNCLPLMQKSRSTELK
jgi:hypothetical protein